jgi:flagellar hook-length control protein FliK
MQIAPLRLEADGIHRLTVNLHPVDLGPVQVIAEIRDGAITVQLSGSTDAGHESLRNAMDDLRRELQQAGFENCSLDLRRGSAGDHGARQQYAAARQSGPGVNGSRSSEAQPAPRTGPHIGNGRLDLHV